MNGKELNFHYDFLTEYVHKDKEFFTKKVPYMKAAGVKTVWLDNYIYGRWQNTPEEAYKAKKMLEEEGFEVQAICVPLGHGGNALNGADSDPTLPSEWRNRQNENGDKLGTTTCVDDTMGSVLTNKYAEGYPAARYYGGCEVVDKVESLAIERLCKIYGAEYANVQPHSGAQANMAVFFAVLKPGDTFLGLNLSHGGHLSHGSAVNMSGTYFNAVSYSVREEDGRVDYDEMEQKALECKPKLIVGGASAYSREWDYKRMREGREINTLGSKSNHAEMQNIVVRMKDELEQIKEQVLNVM